MRGQQHSFSTQERMFLWKCRSFWDRKCLDLRGTRTPNLRIHAECSNHLGYQGQTFADPCFWILALVVQIFFRVKLTFKTLPVRGQQHLFSTHERMFLWSGKVLRQKIPNFYTYTLFFKFTDSITPFKETSFLWHSTIVCAWVSPGFHYAVIFLQTIKKGDF